MAKVAQQLMRVLHCVNTPFVAPLVGKVSTYTLHKMANKLALLHQNNFPRHCTGTYTRYMGLPCAHQLQQLAALNLPVTPDMVRSHWFFPGHCSHGLEHPQAAVQLSNLLCVTNTPRVTDKTEAPVNTDLDLEPATKAEEVVVLADNSEATHST
jgi:hypothetical protein